MLHVKPVVTTKQTLRAGTQKTERRESKHSAWESADSWRKAAGTGGEELGSGSTPRKQFVGAASLHPRLPIVPLNGNGFDSPIQRRRVDERIKKQTDKTPLSAAYKRLEVWGWRMHMNLKWTGGRRYSTEEREGSHEGVRRNSRSKDCEKRQGRSADNDKRADLPRGYHNDKYVCTRYWSTSVSYIKQTLKDLQGEMAMQ